MNKNWVKGSTIHRPLRQNFVPPPLSILRYLACFFILLPTIYC